MSQTVLWWALEFEGTGPWKSLNSMFKKVWKPCNKFQLCLIHPGSVIPYLNHKRAACCNTRGNFSTYQQCHHGWWPVARKPIKSADIKPAYLTLSLPSVSPLPPFLLLPFRRWWFPRVGVSSGCSEESLLLQTGNSSTTTRTSGCCTWLHTPGRTSSTCRGS